MGFGGGGGVNYCKSGKVKSLSEMVFGFIFEEESPENCREEERDDDESFVDGMAEEKSAFWESQRNLLQLALSSKSSLETKVCRATEDALKKIRSSSEGGDRWCSCSSSKTFSGVECRSCLLRSMSDELRRSGYDCGVCKSKWRSSADIPSGEHTYLDVVQEATHKKNSMARRVVIEVNLKAEFEMARASVEYNSLVSNLPEVFVGRQDKLKAVIKTVCAAAKRWMKDNNMHMAPWRKYKYMQAKWLASSSERVMGVPGEETCKELSLLEIGGGSRGGDRRGSNRAMKGSLLTFDLLETNLHCSTTATKVV